MTSDLRDQLSALRELEPADADIARVRAAAAPRRRVLTVPRVAAVTATAMALGVGTALMTADDGQAPLTALGALRAAAAAAADEPAPDDFTGYRYVEMLDHRESPWSIPDATCIRRMEEHSKAVGAAVKRGAELPPRPTEPCEATAKAHYVEEGRQEIWVGPDNRGVRRDNGSRVLSATGDPELAASLREELGRKPATITYVYGDGAFARVPLADLPTEPAELLALLRAAYEDGRWAQDPKSYGVNLTAAGRRHDLAMFTALLLAESNATPALRAAAFGALALMGDVVDLGTVGDRAGREGHGIALRHPGDAQGFLRAGETRVIFDETTGEVLAWADVQGEMSVEWTLVRTGHVAEIPADVRAAVKE